MSAFVNIVFDKFKLKQLLPLVADALPSATENEWTQFNDAFNPIIH